MMKAILALLILGAALFSIFSAEKEAPIDEEHMLSGHQRQMDKAQNLENILEDSAQDRLDKADSVK